MLRLSILAAALLSSASAFAQKVAHTVAPGMTRAQVVAALGEPATARTVSEYTYMFYVNDCGNRCGMNDLVVIRGDSVVDAIFRSPDRRYTGTSSSPAPVSPAAAAKRRGAAPAAQPAMSPAKVRAPRMKPSAPNDTRPSIPLSRQPVIPAPAPSRTKIP